MNIITDDNGELKEMDVVYIGVNNTVYCIRETNEGDGLTISDISNSGKMSITPRTDNSIELR